MLDEERDNLENKFRNLAMMYLRMRDVLSEIGGGDLPCGVSEKLKRAEQAIESFLKTQSDVSKSTQENIKKFRKYAIRAATDDFNKKGIQQFCQELENLIREFAGRAIDVRDKVYDHPSCHGYRCANF